ncbi:uncharacterized protein spats1 [Genypterus blacodes]|uniref:uncharacterized protein spats1 n=1 Tax=Genypterus blacodes TaxID=154954 RepID=UPI003F7756B1
MRKRLQRPAVLGARPYCSPEYSTDFYKISSAPPQHTFWTNMLSNTKRSTQIPPQVSAKTSASLRAKQEEIEEVEKLEEWKPAEDVFTAVLAGLEAKAK